MVIQNVYLHCGYTIDFIEKILPIFFINTSEYHNVHHSKVNIHFGEILNLWDYIYNSGATYYNKNEF